MRKSFPRPAIAALVAASFLASASARAGLRFEQVPTLPGADATALATDGTTVWAGTPHGVWKLSSGAWTFDGLGTSRVTALAPAGGWTYAADGAKVWQRSLVCAPVADPNAPCATIWNAEALPGSVTQPTALATDGSVLWAGGLGVAKKTGSTWVALSSPGGVVVSLAVWSGDVVAGMRGAVARYSGTSSVSMSTGMPSTATVQALASVGGTLWAGTDQTLYSWSGTTWVAEPGFGLHDVRAITGASGFLRVATADAGVLKKTGAWVLDNAGLLTASAKSFAASATDLYVGTAGAPVYRLFGPSWSDAGTGLYGATVSDVATVAGVTFASARGAGFGPVSNVAGGASAPGCGDVRALAGAGAGGGPAPAGSATLLAASSCDVTVFFLSNGAITGSTSAASGLPTGVLPTTLARVADGSVAGGTDFAGMWRYVGSSWTSDNSGLSGSEPILATRPVGSSLFASTGTVLLQRQTLGWQAAPSAPTLVQALGGDASLLFAAPATGIAAATLGGSSPSAWRNDEFGANTAFVSSLDAGSGTAFAGAGTAGVLRKKDGGWQPESMGLPAGIDARVVRVFGNQLFAGTAGRGLFAAPLSSRAKTIPVVLDVVGGTGSRFRSELTLGNRSSEEVEAFVWFAGAPGFPGSGSGATSVTLPPLSEMRIPDALQFLRSHGVAVGNAPAAGSFSIAADPMRVPSAFTDGLYAFSRTYTSDANGSYGVFLEGTSDVDAAEDQGFVYGLRSAAGSSRSNLALVYLPYPNGAPASSYGPVTLSVQVYDQSGAAAGSPIPVTLALGEWAQLNGILLQAGLSEPAYGYAKITRIAGIGAWTGYGVVNDAKTSDGSILPLYHPGGLAAARRLVVPVVLDVFGAAGSHYTTELTLVNDGAFATPVDLFYKPSLGTSSGVSVVTLTLAAGQQTTIPDVLAYLRTHGLNVPDGSTGPQAGTLTVDFRNLFALDAPKTAAIARTTTPNTNASTGGAFGVAYAAVARGGGARASALVPGLTRDANVRSNLAAVHLGGGSEQALSLSVQLYDATTGQPTGGPVTVTLQPGDWTQWSGIFEIAGVPAGVTKAYAVVTRLSGDDTFLVYGVLNDAQTSDGSFLRMIPDREY